MWLELPLDLTDHEFTTIHALQPWLDKLTIFAKQTSKFRLQKAFSGGGGTLPYVGQTTIKDFGKVFT